MYMQPLSIYVHINKSHYFITKFIKFNSKCKLVTEEYLGCATASDKRVRALTHTPFHTSTHTYLHRC